MGSDWLTFGILVLFIFLISFQLSRIFFYSSFPRAVSYSILVFFVTLSCTVISHLTRTTLEQSSKDLSKISGIKTKLGMLVAWALTPSDFSKSNIIAFEHGGVGILFCSLVHWDYWRGHGHEPLQLLMSYSQATR